MTKDICDTCERSRPSDYYSCGVREVSICRAEEKGQQLIYVPRKEVNSTEKETPNTTKNKMTKQQQREQEKREQEIRQAKSKLESACEILGWDNDPFMHILQAKQFLKAYREVENLGGIGITELERKTEVYDFEHVMTLIANSNRLHPFGKATYDLVRAYLYQVIEGKLSDLDGNKWEYANTDYIHQMLKKIDTLINQKESPVSAP